MITVIRRCPKCKEITTFAEQAAATLYDDIGIQPQIIDGTEGEFTVLVDNHPVLQREGGKLPTMDEVKEVVDKAKPVGV